MICNQCGKSNLQDVSRCAYCGAEMPKTSGGGGFADILNYSTVGTVTPRENTVTKSGRMDEAEMKELMKKSDKIMASTRRNSLFGLVAIGLSALIFLTSIVCLIATLSSVKGYKEETELQFAVTRNKIEEYQTQLDTLLESLKETDAGTETNMESEEVLESEGGTETEQVAESEDAAETEQIAESEDDVKTEDKTNNKE